MFIELNVKTKDDGFVKTLINIDLVFTMERHGDITILFISEFTDGRNLVVKETPEEIMQLIKEAKNG